MTVADVEVRSAWRRRLFTLGLVVLLILPAIRNRDGLPLSTYPMYSSARTNITTYVTASGFDASGERMSLSALVIAGSRDRLIAQSFLNDSVARGQTSEACDEIAARAGDNVITIEIASERHDTIARLRGQESLLSRELHTSCRVPG